MFEKIPYFPCLPLSKVGFFISFYIPNYYIAKEMPEKNTIKLRGYTKREVIVNAIMTKIYAIMTKIVEED